MFNVVGADEERELDCTREEDADAVEIGCVKDEVDGDMSCDVELTKMLLL